jgi:hypothetical protein
LGALCARDQQHEHRENRSTETIGSKHLIAGVEVKVLAFVGASTSNSK